MPAMTELDYPVSAAPLDSEDDDEPTRFQLKSSGYQRNSLAQVFTVDAEYRKYALGDVTDSPCSQEWQGPLEAPQGLRGG